MPHILWPEWNSGDDCRTRSEPLYRLQDTPSSALIKKIDNAVGLEFIASNALIVSGVLSWNKLDFDCHVERDDDS